MFRITVTYYMQDTQTIVTDTLDCIADLPTGRVSRIEVTALRGD